MISEVAFARDFSSFWRLTTPMMDGFVRRLNQGAYDRDFAPMTAETAPSRRAFVNEVAFDAASRAMGNARLGIGSVHALLEAAATVRITAASELREGDYRADLSEEELSDAREQIRRLHIRLGAGAAASTMHWRPQFPGCGILDSCQGDVLIGDKLWEVKAGDRLFRSIDLRQILTYLALNHAGHTYSIGSIGLINPRVGISFGMPSDEFCYEASGKDSGHLLDTIVYAICSGDISR